MHKKYNKCNRSIENWENDLVLCSLLYAICFGLFILVTSWLETSEDEISNLFARKNRQARCILAKHCKRQVRGKVRAELKRYGPVTFGRIDLTYKKRMLFVNIRFMFFLYPVIYPPNRFVLGDVRCKYISVRRTKCSAGLAISPPDNIQGVS